MEKIIIISSIVLIPLLSSAQRDSVLDLEAYFSAMIVSNLDTSSNWYENTLGFNVVNRVESKERGFKQSNLKNGEILIELIELDNAIYLKDDLPKYNGKTRVIGFFKTGFLVTNFDEWINHLTSKKIKFYGNIVRDDNTGKRMVIITDPDGNRIQIFEK